MLWLQNRNTNDLYMKFEPDILCLSMRDRSNIFIGKLIILFSFEVAMEYIY